ncbi:MAG: DUF2974 domain-containing protein [Oscillospiraceae bacterium]|nr:DUF2974 domain-containing protein [Oscillospiraceae bacterium]
MANILDYITWRGDIPMKIDGFNEVDNLVLAKLSHINYTGVLPRPGEGEPLTLKETARKYFAIRGETGEDMGLLVPGDVPELLRRAAQSVRFGDMKAGAYVDILDEEREEQFAAFCVETDDGAVYCAFRGTDDTLVGWKEDLNMGVLETGPSQRDALDYLVRAAELYPGRKLYVGGHSKGGNLAVYSAVFAPEKVQDRILAVYNNDGPGFRSDLSELEGYKRIAERIVTLKPQTSVVGQMLEHSEKVTVVHSTGSGIWQHNGFTWEVCGREFVHLPDLSPSGKRTEDTLETVFSEQSIPQREKFVNALYEVLTGTGARTLSDLSDEKLKSAKGMLRTYRNLDDDTRNALSEAITLLITQSAKRFMQDVRETQGKGVDELRSRAEGILRRFFDSEGREKDDNKPGENGENAKTEG